MTGKSSRGTFTRFSVSSAPAVASSLNSYLSAPPSTSSYTVNKAAYNELVSTMKAYDMKIDKTGSIVQLGTCPPESINTVSGMITTVLTPLEKGSNNNVDLE